MEEETITTHINLKYFNLLTFPLKFCASLILLQLTALSFIKQQCMKFCFKLYFLRTI